MTDAPVDFRVVTDRSDDARVVRVVGEVDISTHERLSEELTKAVGSGERVVVDLSACGFIDSSGIRALLLGLRAAEENGASGFALAAASPQVGRVLEMTGVGDAVAIHDSVEQALKAG